MPQGTVPMQTLKFYFKIYWCKQQFHSYGWMYTDGQTKPSDCAVISHFFQRCYFFWKK